MIVICAMPGLDSVEFADFAIIASTPYSPKTFAAYTSITFSPIVSYIINKLSDGL